MVESEITRDIASLARDYITYLILNSYQRVLQLAIKLKSSKYFLVSNLSSVAFTVYLAHNIGISFTHI